MKILLIDDDSYFLDSLSMNLNIRGYDTREFTNPREAVEEYRAGGYDLVITDYSMPGMTGLELLDDIMEFDPFARVIFITADSDINHIIGALNGQAYAFFLKPVDMDRVAMTIEKAERESATVHHR